MWQKSHLTFLHLFEVISLCGFQHPSESSPHNGVGRIKDISLYEIAHKIPCDFGSCFSSSFKFLIDVKNSSLSRRDEIESQFVLQKKSTWRSYFSIERERDWCILDVWRENIFIKVFSIFCIFKGYKMFWFLLLGFS